MNYDYLVSDLKYYAEHPYLWVDAQVEAIKAAANAIEQLVAERDAAIEELSRYETGCSILPSIDAVMVVHGHWITHNPDNPYLIHAECSECGFKQSLSSKFDYCPVCGARMDDETVVLAYDQKLRRNEE